MTSAIYNIDNLVDKFYSFVKRKRSYCISEPVSTMIREIEFVDLLQSLVQYGNVHIFESFQVELEMQCTDLEKRGENNEINKSY